MIVKFIVLFYQLQSINVFGLITMIGLDFKWVRHKNDEDEYQNGI